MLLQGGSRLRGADGRDRAGRLRCDTGSRFASGARLDPAQQAAAAAPPKIYAGAATAIGARRTQCGHGRKVAITRSRRAERLVTTSSGLLVTAVGGRRICGHAAWPSVIRPKGARRR